MGVVQTHERVGVGYKRWYSYMYWNPDIPSRLYQGNSPGVSLSVCRVHRSSGHRGRSSAERTEVSGTGVTRVVTSVIPIQYQTDKDASNKTIFDASVGLFFL